MQKIKISIVRDEVAREFPLPSYETVLSAGMDLRATVDFTLGKGMIAAIPTGIRVAVPEGFEAQVRPRSGNALKFGISIPNSPGTIDADYRGEVRVILVNLGLDDFEIKVGDRIAQMVIAPVVQAQWDEVESLDETVRGEGGFGSTGN